MVIQNDGSPNSPTTVLGYDKRVGLATAIGGGGKAVRSTPGTAFAYLVKRPGLVLKVMVMLCLNLWNRVRGRRTHGCGSATCPHLFDFEDTGIQIGRPLSNITLYGLDGSEVRLESAWGNNRPTLIVTASMSCPVARETMPDLNRLVQHFSDRISVVIVYTVEAHPIECPSPYSGHEWVTMRNIMGRVLCTQPRTLEERLDLTRSFKRRLKVKAPILVDGMDNHAWQTLGAAPNMAILIETNGRVVAYNGWFNADAMTHSINQLMQTEHESGLARADSNTRQQQISLLNEEPRSGYL